MMVSEVCTIQLSIGRHHQDEIHYDVVDMTTCHLLLERPWQFDRNVVHKWKDNTYTFCWKEKKIILVPTTHKPNQSMLTEIKKDNSPNSERKGI